MDLRLKYPSRYEDILHLCPKPLLCLKNHYVNTEVSSCELAISTFGDFLRGPWTYASGYENDGIEKSVIETRDIFFGPNGFCMKMNSPIVQTSCSTRAKHQSNSEVHTYGGMDVAMLDTYFLTNTFDYSGNSITSSSVIIIS